MMGASERSGPVAPDPHLVGEDPQEHESADAVQTPHAALLLLALPRAHLVQAGHELPRSQAVPVDPIHRGPPEDLGEVGHRIEGPPQVAPERPGLVLVQVVRQPRSEVVL